MSRFAKQRTVPVIYEDTDNYVGIIVERSNPKYQSVIDDFNETLEMFHANKP